MTSANLQDPTRSKPHNTASSTSPLWLDSELELGLRPVPITTGLCFPKGHITNSNSVRLLDESRAAVPLDCRTLARWSDGSVKWMLADFLGVGLRAGRNAWKIAVENVANEAHESGVAASVESRGGRISARAGWASIEARAGRIDARNLQGRCPALSLSMMLEPVNGLPLAGIIESAEWEATGDVRSTLRLEGTLPRCHGLRLAARISLFAHTGLASISVTIHNPNRAKHRGGLWDLGDPGSFFFRSFYVEIRSPDFICERIALTAEAGQNFDCPPGPVEIYQDSSGGQNWQSRNHVNGRGRVPCRFRGYQVVCQQKKSSGLRASPTISLSAGTEFLAVAVPEFWQQFPKSLESDGETIRVGLFPRQWDDQFELQGGEQKSHTFWVEQDAHDSGSSLSWVHAPVKVVMPPAWYADAGVFSYFQPEAADADRRLIQHMQLAVDDTVGLLAKREVIDEYGWRNFGDAWADHEQLRYSGPAPVISHYNNQFDMIYGALLQAARTGQTRWLKFLEPLARHVIDIDIYRTRLDRPPYSGGMFWHTDHFCDAGMSTHRTYSRLNKRPGQVYGGGPSNQHNYTTGLLHTYYLTGNPQAREAVLTLANWVIDADDGSKTLLGAIDSGPTGSAVATNAAGFFGPARGSGNSVNALLDAWLLTVDRHYLDKAEEIIRRVVHPHDDVDAQDLLNAEERWSYTIFLVALDRYLELKEEADELDGMFAYGRASLVRYATWMADRERPYFENLDRLEYPTNTWPVQELRKANVLRMAAKYVDDPLRAKMLARGAELSDRAWEDLMGFKSHNVARVTALLMMEGTRDVYFRNHEPRRAPAPACPDPTFPPRTQFVPQKRRVLNKVKTVSGAAEILLRLASPRSWARLIRAIR